LRALDVVLLAVFGLRRIPVLRWFVFVFGALATFSWLLPPVACTCLRVPFRRCKPHVWAEAALRSDLRNLASQQEIYFSDVGVYTADPAALAFTHSDGVRLTIVAGPGGWSAWGRHDAMAEGEGCGMYAGMPPSLASSPDGALPSGGEALHAGESGEVVCIS
jgi:hypothetical protein